MAVPQQSGSFAKFTSPNWTGRVLGSASESNHFPCKLQRFMLTWKDGPHLHDRGHPVPPKEGAITDYNRTSSNHGFLRNPRSGRNLPPRDLIALRDAATVPNLTFGVKMVSKKIGYSYCTVVSRAMTCSRVFFILIRLGL